MRSTPCNVGHATALSSLAARLTGIASVCGLEGEEPIEVAEEWSRVRRDACLYRFRLVGRTRAVRVVVKVPFEQPLPPGARADVARDPPEPYAAHEFRALRAIEAHFAALGGPGFGWIHAFDLLPDPPAVVMQYVPHPSLQDLLLRAHRLRQVPPADLPRCLQRAGAWLSEFHRLSPVNDERPRLCSPAELLESIRSSMVELATHPRQEFVLAEGLAVASASLQALPGEWPLVLGHSDFAAHNMFVAPAGEVIVFDTLANRRQPPYRDLAYFVLTLKLSTVHDSWRAALFDPRLVIGYERELLHGYFGERTPAWRAIRLFELDGLLRKWKSAVQSRKLAKGVLGLAKGVRLLARRRRYVRYFRELIRELAGDAGCVPHIAGARR